MTQVIVSGPFDDIRSPDLRFLEEAARFGPLTVALWPDELVAKIKGNCRFAFEERRYVLEAVRYVDRVIEAETADLSGSGDLSGSRNLTGLVRGESTVADASLQHGQDLHVIPDAALAGFPSERFDPAQMPAGRKRVVVTGCYDWFHSGHVRFFEECSQLGDLYVVVGNDANVRLLKGEGHPLFPQDERRYVVGSCRYVTRALVTSGMGWMDAEPEIAVIKPHMYAVNEDGDKPEKRAFCAEHDIEYVVLKRTPKEGLPRRSSTDLRGY